MGTKLGLLYWLVGFPMIWSYFSDQIKCRCWSGCSEWFLCIIHLLFSKLLFLFLPLVNIPLNWRNILIQDRYLFQKCCQRFCGGICSFGLHLHLFREFDNFCSSNINLLSDFTPNPLFNFIQHVVISPAWPNSTVLGAIQHLLISFSSHLLLPLAVSTPLGDPSRFVPTAHPWIAPTGVCVCCVLVVTVPNAVACTSFSSC